MLLEGKNGKIAWGSSEEMHKFGARVVDSTGKASGDVSWVFEAYHGALKRPKLKAYTVEYGYKKDGKFIVLEDEYYKTDSYEEFSAENKDALPLVISPDFKVWPQ
jgi:hypothetical protein